MPELSPIDPRSTALLVMDYQIDTPHQVHDGCAVRDAIACVPDLIATARDAGIMVIHVIVAFRPGNCRSAPATPCSAR